MNDCRRCTYQLFFFFFQAEDGIRDADVTGVQTCALPISKRFDRPVSQSDQMSDFKIDVDGNLFVTGSSIGAGTLRDFSTIKYCQLETIASLRSEERRVGKECRSRW